MKEVKWTKQNKTKNGLQMMKNSLLLFKLSPKSVLFVGAADVPLSLLAAFKAFTLAPFVTLLLWLGELELFPLTILLVAIVDAFVTFAVIWYVTH